MRFNRSRVCWVTLFFLLIAGVACWIIARPRLDRWGSTDEEARASLPGDVLVTRPDFVSTRAVTIHAPAAAIWPWVVQMGQDRGFYSYQGLQNLVGSGVHNAERIEPALQNLQVGDDFRLHAKMPALKVAAILPGEALVVGAPGDHHGSLAKGLPHVSWAFILNRVDDHNTRLLVRFRADYRADWSGSLLNNALEPIGFLIERKMLLEIRRRAEETQVIARAH